MDLTSKSTGDLVQNATAAAIGFMTFVKVATKGYEFGNNTTNYGLLSKARLEDALANVVGAGAVHAIDPAYGYPAGTGTTFAGKFQPMSAFNKTTYTGAGILVADWVMRDFVPSKYYKSIPILPDAVKGAGIGLLVGGIIGGIFDPAPSGYTVVNPSPLTGQVETGGIATGNVPYARAGSTNAVYKGSILA